MKKLSEIEIGKKVRIVEVKGGGALRQHILDMGVIPGVQAQLMKMAPLGDPLEIEIHGYELTLRIADAANILVETIDDATNTDKVEVGTIQKEKREKTEHLGLGEEGRFHSKKDEHPLSEKTILSYALVGNQNCGKTTLFNQLTGSNQHVGNFPGVTVDRKDGSILGYKNTVITDLPGIYSMSPYTSEEIVSRNFVLGEKPKAIINIVDAMNIERNLYLTMQLLELGIPMVVAVNMMDELHNNGGTIDVNKMEELLGVPVIPISAAKNEGIEELVKHAIHIARYQETPLRQDFCDENEYDGAVHRCIHGVCHLIQDHAKKKDIPLRFAASKVIEGDEIIISQLQLDQNEQEMIEHIVLQMEKERGLDRNAAMADMRFSYIRKVCTKTVIKPKESKERIRSLAIDKILTGKYTAIPCFVGIMLLVFFLSFNMIGAWLQGICEDAITFLIGSVDNLLEVGKVNLTLRSLIVDGMMNGIGSVLSFLPIIIVLFFFLSLMEDSGYIARVAFVMDKLLRKIGLSGRSIVPMLLGFGCSVPAIMATRTLPSERDRKLTILLTPFMSCSAKLPIYVMFSSIFFPRYQVAVMGALYILGIVISIAVAFVLRKTLFKGNAVPFVMELPNYRMPGMKNVLLLLWEKIKDFLQKAFSVILIASMIIWVLQSFDIHFNMVSDSANSMMAAIGNIFVPLFVPLGLGDWRIITSLICGILAKESTVSSLQILFAGTGGIAGGFSIASSASMLVFCLLYIPCVATISVVIRELGKKWAGVMVVWQFFIAWIMAFATHFIINLLI